MSNSQTGGQPVPASSADATPVYDERDRLVILTPCFAHQVTTFFRDSLDRAFAEPTARFRCSDGRVRSLPVVAMAINQPNDSHIDRARNTVLWHFEQTPYRLGLFIDGDQPFEPEHIARTWAHLMSGVRVLGGCVALKTIVTTFAANIRPGAKPDPRTGLIEAQDTGTGWMGFRRDVLDEMRTRWPQHVRAMLAAALEQQPDSPRVDAALRTFAQLGYSADIRYVSNSNTATAGHTLHAYFASGVTLRAGAGDWLSEDWLFCHRCLQLGIPIKIDTQIRVKHFGPMLFPPPPEDLIEAALQVTSGENPPFDPALAASARTALRALHDSVRDRSISILHATRGRPDQARRIHDEFFAQATRPGSAEYIFAVDEDDHASREALAEFSPVIVPPSGGIVAALNAAAARAKGRILVMAADDCHPCDGWDAAILAALAGQLHLPRLLWVSDGYSAQPIATHPIITRALYERHGWFFHPDYTHLFCDTDLTERARLDGHLIDARHIVFRHDHPMFTGAPADALHLERNSSEAWASGRAVFLRHFPEHRARGNPAG